MRRSLFLLAFSLACSDKPPADDTAPEDTDVSVDDTGKDTGEDTGPVDDTGCETPWYPDADSDGWGSDEGVVLACDAPEGHVALGGDCDDDSDVFHPFAEDIVGDLYDHDCDGLDCQSMTVGDAHFAVCLAFKDHAASRAICTDAGLEIASIRSEEENDTVAWTMDGLGTGFAWHGYTDVATEGTFVWTDGAPDGYENWAPDEPNDEGGEDCGLIQANLDYAWNDTVCSNASIGGVVCQLRR